MSTSCSISVWPLFSDYVENPDEVACPTIELFGDPSKKQSVQEEESEEETEEESEEDEEFEEPPQKRSVAGFLNEVVELVTE